VTEKRANHDSRYALAEADPAALRGGKARVSIKVKGDAHLFAHAPCIAP